MYSSIPLLQHSHRVIKYVSSSSVVLKSGSFERDSNIFQISSSNIISTCTIYNIYSILYSKVFQFFYESCCQNVEVQKVAVRIQLQLQLSR